MKSTIHNGRGKELKNFLFSTIENYLNVSIKIKYRENEMITVFLSPFFNVHKHTSLYITTVLTWNSFG